MECINNLKRKLIQAGRSYVIPYKVQKKNKHWPNLTLQGRNVNIINNLNELRNKLSSFILNVENFIPKLSIEEKYSIKYL